MKALIVGIGGLGCPAALSLAENGLTQLDLMDPDRVESSNLHRQILYSSKDVGRPKVEAAKDALLAKFPNLQVRTFQQAFEPASASEKFAPYDLIIDGLDRLEKKFLLNDWCVKLRKPFVHAGVVKFEGQVLAVRPGVTACLRCLMPKIPPPFAMPTCQEAGVLGSFSQGIGYLQGLEAMNLMRGKGPLRLWKLDVHKREVRTIIPTRAKDCPACGDSPAEKEPDMPMESCSPVPQSHGN